MPMRIGLDCKGVKKVNAKLVYTDKAGNKLYVRYIKTRNSWQWTAKNREGRIVKSSDVREIMIRALRERKAQWKKLGHHEMVSRLEKLVEKLPKARKKVTKSGHRIQRVKVA